MSSKPFASLLRLAVVAVVALMIQGCGMLYKTGGNQVLGFGARELMPYMLTGDDIRMACAAGESMAQVLLSFERFGADPDKLAVLIMTTSSICTDELAMEAELAYMRAIKQGNVSEAQDARIRQKRYAALSAKRQYAAYTRLIGEYGEEKNGECPKLKKDFDEMVWLIGMVSGMMALMNDSTADSQGGIPRDIAAKVERGATCLDNKKWWGVPRGIRAAVWNFLPMMAPKNAKPWEELEQAAKIGFSSGVRLGSAMYALSAYSKNDDAKLRKAIKDFVANDKNLDPQYRMFDAMASNLIMGISDRMWTENTGKRTPLGGLGTFWDDRKNSAPSVNIDDLL